MTNSKDLVQQWNHGYDLRKINLKDRNYDNERAKSEGLIFFHLSKTHKNQNNNGAKKAA